MLNVFSLLTDRAEYSDLDNNFFIKTRFPINAKVRTKATQKSLYILKINFIKFIYGSVFFAEIKLFFLSD